MNDFYESDEICEGCGMIYGNGHCPFCCPYAGLYQPGTEECDFCEHEKECRKERIGLFIGGQRCG